MIKIPELEPCNYENLLIKPVIKNQSVIHLDINEIFVSNNKILTLPKNCKASNLIKICKQENTIDLRESKCISISSGKGIAV